MNMITQEARKKQEIVNQAIKNGKSYTSRKYGVSLSTLKRWCKKYDGTWQSLLDKSHRPHNHPSRHTPKEEKQIKNSFKKCYARYGWDGVYDDLLRKGYTRSFSGMVYAAKRLGLKEKKQSKKKSRAQRRYPELLEPGEKVQIDVKEVPYNCLRGKVLRDEKHLYQWTAIDECTRMRFVYGFEEHTPENSVRFLAMLIKAFPFKIKTIQTDNRFLKPFPFRYAPLQRLQKSLYYTLTLFFTKNGSHLFTTQIKLSKNTKKALDIHDIIIYSETVTLYKERMFLMGNTNRTYNFSAASNLGMRSNNQDKLSIVGHIPLMEAGENYHLEELTSAKFPALFAVSDGVGSLEDSAETAFATLRLLNKQAEKLTEDTDLSDWSLSAVEEIQYQLTDFMARNGLSGANTLVYLLLTEECFLFGNVGDSPGFILKDGEALKELSIRHNLETYKKLTGQHICDGDSSVLIYCFGDGITNLSDIVCIEQDALESGDRFLICSDGITNALNESEITQMLHARVPAIEFVNRAGVIENADNCTAVVIYVD